MLNTLFSFTSEYTSGADIVMQDTYMIGNNVTFSTQWDTPCTEDYGDCGYVATNLMQSSAVYSIRVHVQM